MTDLATTSRSIPHISSIYVGENTVPAVPSARNIGSRMDNHLTMVEHVSGACKASYFHPRNIAQIRRYLTQDAAATLIHSLVNSRLDKLNSLLFGLPDSVTVIYSKFRTMQPRWRPRIKSLIM